MFNYAIITCVRAPVATVDGGGEMCMRSVSVTSGAMCPRRVEIWRRINTRANLVLHVSISDKRARSCVSLCERSGEIERVFRSYIVEKNMRQRERGGGRDIRPSGERKIIKTRIIFFF